MTAEEFNQKYADHLPKGWYGMAINDREIIEYLDDEFDRYIQRHPDFEFHQIKLKFNDPRVYTNAPQEQNSTWERHIRFILEDDSNLNHLL
jgi:hypothetical protein